MGYVDQGHAVFFLGHTRLQLLSIRKHKTHKQSSISSVCFLVLRNMLAEAERGKRGEIMIRVPEIIVNSDSAVRPLSISH